MSEVLPPSRETEAPTPTHRSSRPDSRTGPDPDRIEGAQEFLVEWEVPQPS